MIEKKTTPMGATNKDIKVLKEVLFSKMNVEQQQNIFVMLHTELNRKYKE